MEDTFNQNIVLLCDKKLIHLAPNSFVGSSYYTVFDLIADTGEINEEENRLSYSIDNGVGVTNIRRARHCDITVHHSTVSSTLTKTARQLSDDDIEVSPDTVYDHVHTQIIETQDPIKVDNNTYQIIGEDNRVIEDVIVDITAIILTYYKNEIAVIRRCIGNDIFETARLVYHRDSGVPSVKIDFTMSVFDHESLEIIEWVESRSNGFMDVKLSLAKKEDRGIMLAMSLWVDMTLSIDVPLKDLKKAQLLFFRNDFHHVVDSMSTMITPKIDITFSG